MDTDYRTVCADFDLALSVLGTVISRTQNERMVLDIGLKEISSERGLPVLKNLEGACLRRLNAEHAIVDILDPKLFAQVGDQVQVLAHIVTPRSASIARCLEYATGVPSMAVCESRQIQTAGSAHKTRTGMGPLNSAPLARQRACRLS
jgi:Putative serine dehydratase domain